MTIKRAGMALRAAACGLICMAVSAANAASFDVIVKNVRNGQGEIWVAVCSRQTFLKETCQHMARVQARPGTVTAHFANVPPGIWAAQAFHDENDNGKIDRNFFGIPTEGIGFSNDVKFRFGPPLFEDAAFQLTPAGKSVSFSLRYTF